MNIPKNLRIGWKPPEWRDQRNRFADAIREIQYELGDLKAVERGILIDLFLSYRDAEAFEDMIALYNEFPSELKNSMVQDNSTDLP